SLRPDQERKSTRQVWTFVATDGIAPDSPSTGSARQSTNLPHRYNARLSGGGDMFARFCLLVLAAILLGLGSMSRAQDAPPPPLPVPDGIEVQARGPIHEAFAGPTTEAAPTTAIDKKPPAMIDELPPAEKPSGNVIWISGYWAYDEDHKDYLWV